MKVAITGFGDEGLSSYNYFKKLGAEITIFDANEHSKVSVPEGAKFVHGPDYLDHLQGFDKVVRLPAIAPGRIQTDGEVTSNIREFLRVCPTPQVIGVTATKGKGTICSLIAAILAEAGYTVHLAGNIGVPPLSILASVQADDIVVLELSSFQLWDMTTSPHVAVVGMIEPEHLEVHTDFAEYLAAKGRIAKYQKPDDVVIYHPSNQYSKQIAEQSRGQHIAYATNEGEGAYIANDTIAIAGQTIVATDQVRIPGQHNLENICAAITAAWQYTQDIAAIKRAIQTFTGLEHRLEFVAEVEGVKYYNDSISTTPGSVIAALHSFAPAHELLIIGGTYDKGVDYTPLAAALAELQPKCVLFVGPMGQKIAAQAEAADFKNGEVFAEWTMPMIVEQAKKRARPGDVVILSPATASFGDFQNYKERGEQFKAAAQAIL